MRPLRSTVADSTTMLRRELKRLWRYPSMTVLLVGMPIVFLLLFVYVFGGQLGSGLGGGHRVGPASRGAYLNFIVPGILLMTVAAAANGRAILIAMDMTEGIIARFRTMAIARAAVLTGHVLASVVQALLGIAVVVGVGLTLGFRPTAGPLQWIGAVAIMAMFAFALAWLAVALGLAAKSVETASNTPMVLTLLPFLGSGFVTVASLPAGLREFARYQPFTPVTDALRGLITGHGASGSDAIRSIAWSTAIALASYLWARHLYARPRPA